MPTSCHTAQRLLTVHEASEYLGVTTGTLATWRSTKRYPLAYVKVGKRVMYRMADLEEWVESRVSGE